MRKRRWYSLVSEDERRDALKVVLKHVWATAHALYMSSIYTSVGEATFAAMMASFVLATAVEDW